VQSALVEPLRRWDPERVGGYVLLGRLGAGAMGQVYLGRSAAGRLVAVKTIKSELAEEPDFRTRFGQEVAAARRVSGAFTAAVVAADSEADVPWLATVYVPAPSLSKLVRTCGPLPPAAVRWLAAGCAEALEAIHSVGLVHRDLKPSNVLVSPDGPRVIDFGVARAAERIQLTVTRGSIGTPAYMAPEQARDTRQATPASDIFSLGATTLFAATGHAPYEGETVMDVLVRLATEPPDLTGLPAELTDTVRACMERDPRSRPNSAAIVARLAPGGDLGPSALPPAALDLIAEFRDAPATARWADVHVAGGADVDAGGAGRAADGNSAFAEHVVRTAGPDATGETTLGSHPVLSSEEPGPVAPLVDYPGSSSPSAAGPPGPAGRGPQGGRSRSTGARTRARPASARPARRRAVLAAASAVVAAALIAGGWAVGTSVADGDRPAQLGPAIPPPPGGAPGQGPPPSTTAQGGKPAVALNQDYGDTNTIFVVHGANWPVRKSITITLVGVGTSPIHPLADSAGTFNYAINQDHEFFRGGLPVGTYTVLITGAGGIRAEARFVVQRS
jgi:Protein kinase domain